MEIERLQEQLEESSRRIAQLVAERERLLWLVCCIERDEPGQDEVYRILAEHGYDHERIGRMAAMPEPAVPR